MQIIEETALLVKVSDEGNEYWIKRTTFEKLTRPRTSQSIRNSEKTVQGGLLDLIRKSQKPVFTGYGFSEASQVMEELKNAGYNINSLGTLSGAASSLHKQNLIRYADGGKNSGWIAV